MTITIVAPDKEPPRVQSAFGVFLAGAIDMGAAVDWQSWIIAALEGRSLLHLFNPRREAFTPDTLDEQIAWELDALNRAEVVLMWFPASAKAPVAMLETGLFMQSGKLVIGAEPGFYRRRNLEMTCDYFNVRLCDSLGMLAGMVVHRYAKWIGEAQAIE